MVEVVCTLWAQTCTHLAVVVIICIIIPLLSPPQARSRQRHVIRHDAWVYVRNTVKTFLTRIFVANKKHHRTVSICCRLFKSQREQDFARVSETPTKKTYATHKQALRLDDGMRCRKRGWFVQFTLQNQRTLWNPKWRKYCLSLSLLAGLASCCYLILLCLFFLWYKCKREETCKFISNYVLTDEARKLAAHLHNW